MKKTWWQLLTEPFDILVWKEVCVKHPNIYGKYLLKIECNICNPSAGTYLINKE